MSLFSLLTPSSLPSATDRWHQSPLGRFFARFVADFPEVGRLPFRLAKEEAAAVWRTMSTAGRTPFVEESAAVKEEVRRARRAEEELRRVRQREIARRRKQQRGEIELRRVQERVARALYYEYRGIEVSRGTVSSAAEFIPRDPRAPRSPPPAASSTGSKAA